VGHLRGRLPSGHGTVRADALPGGLVQDLVRCLVGGLGHDPLQGRGQRGRGAVEPASMLTFFWTMVEIAKAPKAVRGARAAMIAAGHP
jgi:hypothetical protein